MRVCSYGPPTLIGVAGNSPGLEHGSTAIPARVVGPATVPNGSLIALRQAIEPLTVSVADFLPNPPTVIRRNAIDITVPIAEQQQPRGGLYCAGTADIILITLWSAKRWRSTSYQ